MEMVINTIFNTVTIYMAGVFNTNRITINNWRLFHGYWDLHTKKIPLKTSTLNPLANRKRDRWFFTSEQHDSPNQKRGRRKFTSAQLRPASFTPTLISNMASSRFASLEGPIETFIEEQENQNTAKETKRDVASLTEFLQTKRDTNWNSWNSSRRTGWMNFWVNLF